MEASLINPLSIFFVFMLCGLSIFAVPVFLVDLYKILYMIIITVAFLISYLWARREERLQKYQQVVLAFFIASLAIILQIYWSAGDTVEGIVFNKLISTIIIVTTILVLVWATSRDLDSLYLKKGDLRQGAITGTIVTFASKTRRYAHSSITTITGTIVTFAFVITAVPFSIWLFGGQEVTMDRLLSLTPWITAFVLLNGIREELLFRGLFLKKYESFFSPDMSNVLQALIFASAHLLASIDVFAIMLLVLTFFLGLVFGAVMQKTDSIIGAVICHAAADVPYILAVFSFL